VKKVLLIPLAIIILITFIAPSPLPVIGFRDEETLAKIRRIAESEIIEEELVSLRNDLSFNGLKSREEILSFLELLDSLPILYVPEAQLIYLDFLMTSKKFYIWFETPDGGRYRLTFNAGLIDENYVGSISVFHENREDSIRVFSDGQQLRERINIHIAIYYTPEHDDLRYNSFFADFWKSAIVTSFAESPWFDKPEPVIEDEPIIEDEPEPFTSADALIILQAAAGLIELSDEDIVRFEIDGTPTTADAMRILRLVAGL
jgi:hypothetical protein